MIATVTHARVRAEQGDLSGALAVLRGVLAASPGDAEAIRLRDRLAALASARRLRAWIGIVRRRRSLR